MKKVRTPLSVGKTEVLRKVRAGIKVILWGSDVVTFSETQTKSLPHVLQKLVLNITQA